MIDQAIALKLSRVAGRAAFLRASAEADGEAMHHAAASECDGIEYALDLIASGCALEPEVDRARDLAATRTAEIIRRRGAR